jgi:hypothetical protein
MRMRMRVRMRMRMRVRTRTRYVVWYQVVWCGWCGVVCVWWSGVARGLLMYPSKLIRTCVLDSVSNNVT